MLIFVPSPFFPSKTTQQQPQPQHVCWHKFPTHTIFKSTYTATSHGGAIKSTLHRGWGCTGSTWQIEICGLRAWAKTIGWVLNNKNTAPNATKTRTWFCGRFFFGKDFLLGFFWRFQNWQVLIMNGCGPTKMSLIWLVILATFPHVFFFSDGSDPNSKQGWFKVNQKKSTKKWDASKQTLNGMSKNVWGSHPGWWFQRYFIVF